MIKLGFAMCGSFCTFAQAIAQMRALSAQYEIVPIMSESAYATSTRFGTTQEIHKQIEEISGKEILHTIAGTEPVGPQKMVDVMLVAPCTGNTLGKLACGITDTAVTMAVKSTLRIDIPVVLCVASNDALSASAKNIGKLLNTKNIFFVPMGQDDPHKKPHSLVSNFEKIAETLALAQNQVQTQPIFF